MIHTHINIFENPKFISDNKGGFFFWIECRCGLTGINDNGKEVWNKSNMNKKTGKMVFNKLKEIKPFLSWNNDGSIKEVIKK